MEYLDSDGRLTGLGIQLIQAVAAKLGLSPEFTPDAFTAIQSGVRSGRFELAAAGLSLAKGEVLTTDAVIYLGSGIRLARLDDSDLQLDDLCGHRVAALEGSQQLSALRRASATCADSGAAPIAITAFLTQDEVTRSALTRRAEGMVADAPVVAAAAHSYPSELEVAPGEIDPSPFAMLVGDGLAALVAQALDELIDDGTYDEILRSFGVTEGAVARAGVLPAGQPAEPGMIVVRTMAAS